MPLEIFQSGDGTHSLYHPELDETYHSRHGSLNEARHVFLESGLFLLQDHPEIRIFEMGLGTGLNALLTWQAARDRTLQIRYYGLEKFPVESSIWKQLNYVDQIGDPALKQPFQIMHEGNWEESLEIGDRFQLYKIKGDLLHVELPEPVHLVYFDAFGPRVQPDLWSEAVFDRLFNWLLPGGILVTYSSKGDVKRAMIKAGFEIEKIPGPPGKREMLRARKM